YGALFPELFKKDEERAKTNGFRQICQLFAMAISIALTPMITEKIGYRTTAIVYGAVALAVMMYCFWGCREPELIDEEVEKPKLFSSIFALITNPKFWIYGFCGAFYSAAFSLISQAIPFYVKYTLKKGGSTTTIMLGTVLAVAVIGIVIWSNIVRKWDIMKVWRSGFIIMAVSFIPLYFVNSFSGAVAIACIVGFGVAACLVTMDCIGAKIVDDDFRRHGIKREGIISSLVGVMNRLNGLYTSLAFYFVSTQFGFVNGDDPGTDPALASRVLLCVFPAAAMVIASVISFFLHFNGKDEKVSDNQCR
ncbi:MAG: MFS transporter, partial [Clostridia bacterium]|nr:MFS transporter [Clostridia bacterium]